MNTILLLTDTGKHDQAVLQEAFYAVQHERRVLVGAKREHPEWSVIASNSGSIDAVADFAIKHLKAQPVFLIAVDLLYQDDKWSYMPRGLTDVYERVMQAGLSDRWKVRPIIYSRAMHEQRPIPEQAAAALRHYGFSHDIKKEDFVDRVSDEWMDRFVGICYSRMSDYVSVHGMLPTYP